jgi:hypothetical protein
MDAKTRKRHPLYSGLLKYFPDACMDVAHCSWVGNEQHNPGEPLHWAREKSTDQEDALMRHLKDAGTIDSDGIRHSAKVAWRALAMLQLEIEGANRAAAAKYEETATINLGTGEYKKNPPKTQAEVFAEALKTETQNSIPTRCGVCGAWPETCECGK